MDAYVSRDVLRLLAIGIVAVTAISMGAATIDSTVQLGDPSGDGPTIGGGDDDPQDEGGGDGGPDEQIEPPGDREDTGGTLEVTRCVRPLSAWYGAIGYFGMFGGVLYLIKRRYSFGAAFMGMYALAPVVFLAYFLATDCATVGGPGPGDGGNGSPFGDVAGEGILSPDVSPLVFVGLFGVLLVATAAVLIRASGDQAAAATAGEDGDEVDRPDVADLAQAAGAAADRLEERNADVDNEVYQAWWEMISLLNVSEPDSYTPGEFADEAIELGMDEDHVSALTTLFNEVRYGERDPESREERAIEIFREIESQYGGGRSGSAAGSTEGDDGR